MGGPDKQARVHVVRTGENSPEFGRSIPERVFESADTNRLHEPVADRLYIEADALSEACEETLPTPSHPLAIAPRTAWPRLSDIKRKMAEHFWVENFIRWRKSLCRQFYLPFCGFFPFPAKFLSLYVIQLLAVGVPI